MKGFAWTGKGQAGWIEKESPVIGPLDAKVRPLAVAPCSSDVSIIEDMEMPNVILGHESVGVVEKVGSVVKHFNLRLSLTPSSFSQRAVSRTSSK